LGLEIAPGGAFEKQYLLQLVCRKAKIADHIHPEGLHLVFQAELRYSACNPGKRICTSCSAIHITDDVLKF